jgi:protein ImuB
MNGMLAGANGFERAARWQPLEASVRGCRLAEAIAGIETRTAGPAFACHQADRDRQALRQLAVECEQFSPLVGVDEGDEPDGLRMDLHGLARLFGSEQALMERVVEFFQRRGYQVRLAIADSPSAAGALARFHPGAAPCMIAAPGDRGVLAQLPMAALQLPETTEQLLQHLGICRLEQLQRLPRGSLAARFGPQLLQRLDQITGEVDEVIVACRPPEDLTVQMAFEHPVAHPEAITAAIQQLLAQLAPRLIVQGVGVLQLECSMLCQNRQAREIRIGLFQPTADPGHLLALIRMQLERLKLPEPVQEIRVAAISTAVRSQRQSELFADMAPRDPVKLGWLIERLSNRLGRERVLQARLQADAQSSELTSVNR